MQNAGGLYPNETKAYMIRKFRRYLAFIIVLPLVLAGCAGPYATSSMEDAAKTKQVQLAPEQIDTALRLARAARSSGDFASAVNLYRDVTAVKPVDPAIMIELGDTLVDAGAIDDAIGVYTQIPEKSDARVAALLGLERTSFALGHFDEALVYADTALALAPNDEKVLIGRGVALDRLGQHEEAQISYRAVIATAPNNLAARNDLALSLALSGKFEEATYIMTSIARSTTSTARTRQNLALIYGLMGEKERARELSLVDLSPADTESNLHFFDLVASNDDQRNVK